MIALTARQAEINGEVWTIVEARGLTFGVKTALKEAGFHWGYPKDLFEASRAARGVEPGGLRSEELEADWGKFERYWQKAFRGTVEQNRRHIREIEEALRLNRPPAAELEPFEPAEDDLPF